MSQALRLLLVIGLALVAGMVQAQSTKAYAPENLRQLEVRDRVRVIEREYADQSGGRRIPDDQLEFYLDQVDSGWSFSRIKQDIAESLGGGARHWQPPRGGQWEPSSVICSSEDYGRTNCRKPFAGPAVLIEQFSEVRCVEGQTWGQQRDIIWVDRGCRGRFAVDPRPRSGAGRPLPGQFGPDVVVCESLEGRRRRCQTPFHGAPQIVEQFSNAPCVEGRTWGWDRGEVWVSRGCRAAFGEGGQGRGHPATSYTVTCASEDNRYRTCAWNDRAGRPFLIEQFSDSPCIEGRSWGYTREGLWVDRGCRARFGAR